MASDSAATVAATDAASAQRLAVVIGASGGIGAATVARLAADGWTVVGLDRPDAVHDGAVAPLLPADLADPASIADAFAALAQRLGTDGRIDLLAVCSGIVDNLKVATVPLAHWNHMLAVNLTGPFLCCQHAYPLLRDGGRIVLVGSLAGRTGGVLTGAAYAATKGGLESLAKSMAQELAPRRITVNVVAPGAIDTPMLKAHTPERRHGMAASTPLGRLGQPQEIAAAISYLAGADAGFVTGAVLHVNGGIRMD